MGYDLHWDVEFEVDTEFHWSWKKIMNLESSNGFRRYCVGDFIFLFARVLHPTAFQHRSR